MRPRQYDRIWTMRWQWIDFHIAVLGPVLVASLCRGIVGASIARRCSSLIFCIKGAGCAG